MKRDRLRAISGLKVIAVLLVFCWHAFSDNAMPKYGARCCDFLFVVSGFLVAYNNHNKFENTITSTIDYVKRKLKKFYPVYLTSLIATIAVMCLQHKGVSWFNYSSLVSLVWNLMLLQAWFPQIAMSYNGLAWFLSALLFCYAMSPVLSIAAKGICRQFGEKRGEFLLLLLLVVARLFLDCCVSGANRSIYNLDLYTSPLARVLDYSIAYAAGLGFMSLSPKMRLSYEAYCIAEVIAVAATIFVVFRFDKVWNESYYVLFFLIPTIVFSLGGGFLSRLLSASLFSLMEKYETEFYLFHQIPLKILWVVFPIIGIHGERKTAIIAFILTVLICLAYRACGTRVHKVDRWLADKDKTVSSI